jgi:DNA-binding LytR/AlgR family response regulator
MQNSNLKAGGTGSFLVRTAEGYRLVNTHRVAYLKARNRWCEIVKLDGASVEARHSLKEMEVHLTGVFLRLDRFHLLNTRYVYQVSRLSRDESMLDFEEGGVCLRIGRAGMSKLRKLRLSLLQQGAPNFNVPSFLRNIQM